MRTPALVIVGLLMISGLAWAYPTSLNVIPTADMLDPVLFDWIGGDENYLTAGIYLETRSGPAFNIGVGFPNSGENSNLALVKVSWTWSPK